MMLDEDRAVAPLLASPFNESNPAVSPDGAWITAGRPETLFEGPYLDDLARNYDLAPDGRFLMIRMAFPGRVVEQLPRLAR